MTTTDLPAAAEALRRWFPEGGRVLCAVSGGLDSMCLLDFMARQPGFTVAAAHFHHGLRGDAADRDEQFVADWCARRAIPCHTGRGDTRRLAEETGQTIEEAARTLRYDFLQKTANHGSFDAIFTAHHSDDNAETILLNLLRGTGSAGLGGIPPVRGNIYRPFLALPRSALVAYAAARSLPHVEDETNQLDFAARNVLRHRVLPVLRELNPAAVENIGRAGRILSRESEAMEALADELTARAETRDDTASLSWAVLAAAPAAVAERAVLNLLAEAAGCRQDLSAAHVEAVLALPEDGCCDLPCGLTARREQGSLRICRKNPPAPVTLLPDCPVRWGDYTITLLSRPAGPGLALRGGDEPLTAAPCDPGARLRLPEGRGPRTVKRLCLDKKITLTERERLPALWVEGRPAAVWKLGVDTEFLPVGESCRFVQIIEEKGEHLP